MIKFVLYTYLMNTTIKFMGGRKQGRENEFSVVGLRSQLVPKWATVKVTWINLLLNPYSKAHPASQSCLSCLLNQQKGM